MEHFIQQLSKQGRHLPGSSVTPPVTRRHCGVYGMYSLPAAAAFRLPVNYKQLTVGERWCLAAAELSHQTQPPRSAVLLRHAGLSQLREEPAGPHRPLSQELHQCEYLTVILFILK